MRSRGKRCVISLLRNALAQGRPRRWQCVPFRAPRASLALLEADIACAMPPCDSDQPVSQPARVRTWQQQFQNARRECMTCAIAARVSSRRAGPASSPACLGQLVARITVRAKSKQICPNRSMATSTSSSTITRHVPAHKLVSDDKYSEPSGK